jgi:uncharacterized membrane protein YfcA
VTALSLFAATLFGETMGSMVGGGSFVVQPAVLAAGFGMHQAIALDISASCLTSVTGLATLRHAGKIPPAVVVVPAMLGGIGGALIGPKIMAALSAGMLAWIFASAALVVLALTWRLTVREQDAPKIWTLPLIGLVLGIWTGLSGAGSGIMAVALLTKWGGLSNMSAIAVRKFIFIPATIVAAASYAIAGQIDWIALLPMAVGCAFAGWCGTTIMLRLGDVRLGHLFRGAAALTAIIAVFRLA